MPSIYIRPVIPSDTEPADPMLDPDQSPPDEGASQDGETQRQRTEIVECPVFMNRSRQVCVFTLKLKCPEPAEKWAMAGVALILDPGKIASFVIYSYSCNILGYNSQCCQIIRVLHF